MQGHPAKSKRTLFLLPDGSGSGMAYVMLPEIHPDLCVVCMNSPFLEAPAGTAFTVESIAAIWVEEIRRQQLEGPYLLGGWSAGGYYSFEVAKILLRDGQKVEKLLLIDSPCRLVYEPLPFEVVQFLSTQNMMGGYGPRKPPEWMIRHFDMTLKAVSAYHPTPMETQYTPAISIIWASDPVLEESQCAATGLDFNVKVTRMLLRRPESDGPQGWDTLFPGSRLSIEKSPGNHFTMVFPPHCDALGAILRDSLRDYISF
ncbi:alpha/beta-hydrolase [Lophiostoma macrostomum CBS 122681]|uniref:Alpha/beta-hydrolase n=1 Tax=Lophiostoma macrostomum CBS 122681 TaxID=1314788 RepID=A0A6A6TRF0_9PLEO|nr:alpha/beta-hydrolase [Lophiostoma macrostomum CBS 122681]